MSRILSPFKLEIELLFNPSIPNTEQFISCCGTEHTLATTLICFSSRTEKDRYTQLRKGRPILYITYNYTLQTWAA